MFCQKCGSEIQDDAIVCAFCGTEVKKQEAPKAESYQPATEAAPPVTSVFSILALVGSFIAPIVGLIFSIIGLTKYKADVQPSDRARCIAGLIISIVSWVINLIIYIAYIDVFTELLEEYMYY